MQLDAIAARPDLAMAFCRVDEFVSQDSEPARTGAVQIRKSVPAYLPSGLLVKRTAFERVGLFSTSFGVGEFIDWYARAMDAGIEGVVLPASLLERRLHDANQGATKRDSYQTEYLKILKKTLDRRRAKKDG